MASMCTVRLPEDGEYAGVFGDAKTIEHVRYVERSELERSGYVYSDGSKGTLFIDPITSVGAFELPEGALVSIDGAPEVAVVKCEPKIGFGNDIHHWEVEVA